MPEKLSALARLFADDTVVYKTISNGHNDQAQLQEDLQRLADWEESWDMDWVPPRQVPNPVAGSLGVGIPSMDTPWKMFHQLSILASQ